MQQRESDACDTLPRPRRPGTGCRRVVLEAAGRERDSDEQQATGSEREPRDRSPAGRRADGRSGRAAGTASAPGPSPGSTPSSRPTPPARRRRRDRRARGSSRRGREHGSPSDSAITHRIQPIGLRGWREATSAPIAAIATITAPSKTATGTPRRAPSGRSPSWRIAGRRSRARRARARCSPSA